MRITGGALRGRVLKTVSGPGYRPATSKVREAVFSMLHARGVAWEGARLLDLFAGSGSLGFEALSRGAAMVWFVEKDKAAAACIRENAEALGIAQERWKVLPRDVATVLGAGPGDAPFDVVCIDPPYGKHLLPKTLGGVVRHGWLAPEALILAEIEAGLRYDPALADPSLTVVTDRAYGQTRIVIWIA
ncbi:MAG: 16S rRNA (guanine(966)-N(2))-methyltransferase RsmD [Desulfovibrionaceae bacterium]